MVVKAVVFDLDDTLYDEHEYVLSGFQSLDRWVAECYQIHGFYEKAVELFNSGHKERIFDRALEELGADCGEGFIQELVQYYRAHAPRIHLYQDARWILKELKGKVKLGLITDGYLIAQQQKIEALKLTHHFDSILMTDSLGRENWKPSAIPYTITSSRLEVPGTQCVYVGDNVKKDFVTANQLGWTTVHIKRPDSIYSGLSAEPGYQAHYQIDSLKKLSEIQRLQHLFERGESYVS